MLCWWTVWLCGLTNKANIKPTLTSCIPLEPAWALKHQRSPFSKHLTEHPLEESHAASLQQQISTQYTWSRCISQVWALQTSGWRRPSCHTVRFASSWGRDSLLCMSSASRSLRQLRRVYRDWSWISPRSIESERGTPADHENTSVKCFCFSWSVNKSCENTLNPSSRTETQIFTFER